MTGAAFPPGLTPDIVDRAGHVLRQAASRAHTGKPVNPFELANVAAALLGEPAPAWSAPSEFPDTSAAVHPGWFDVGEQRTLAGDVLRRDLEVGGTPYWKHPPRYPTSSRDTWHEPAGASPGRWQWTPEHGWWWQ